MIKTRNLSNMRLTEPKNSQQEAPIWSAKPPSKQHWAISDTATQRCSSYLVAIKPASKPCCQDEFVKPVCVGIVFWTSHCILHQKVHVETVVILHSHCLLWWKYRYFHHVCSAPQQRKTLKYQLKSYFGTILLAESNTFDTPDKFSNTIKLFQTKPLLITSPRK